MTKTTSISGKSKESKRSPLVYITLFATLVSAVVSLIVGIVSLNRRRQPVSFRINNENLIGDQDFLSGGHNMDLTQPVTGQTSLAENAMPAERYSSKTSVISSDITAAEGSNSVDEVPVQGLAPSIQEKPVPWSQPTKYIVGVGLFLALLGVIYLSRDVLGMIIFAALLAFVVQPVIGFFQRRLRMKRGSSIGLSYLLVVLALILIPIILIPAIIRSVNSLLSVDWQQIGHNFALTLQSAAQNVSLVPVFGSSLAALMEMLAQVLSGASSLQTPAPIVVDVSVATLGSKLGNLLGKLAVVLGPMISALASIIFILLISLRMSLSAEQISEAYPKLVPTSYKGEVTDLIGRILNVWNSFLRGQLSLMVVMGVLTYLLNLLLGTPSALFLGFAAGLLEIVPTLGPILATIPAVILALIFGSSWLPVSNFIFAIIIILAYVLLSEVENQFLGPKILGDAVDLPPLVVLIGILVGGSAFGLLGIFLATPVISTAKKIFGYLYNKILESPPVTEPPEEKPSIMDTLKGFAQRIRLPFRQHNQEPAPPGKVEQSTG
jgi:predicted PurR-regulated permease PerM